MKYILSITLCIFALISTVHAQTIGFITNLDGNPTITRGYESLRSELHLPIHLGDKIETTLKEKIEITFIDESQITITPESLLTIDRYMLDFEQPKNNNATYSIKGGFHYISGLISKIDKPDVKIQLPLASIGIRGTKVWANTLDNECRIYLEDGLAIIENKSGSTTLTHETGARLEMSTDSAPSDAETWHPDVISWLKETTAFPPAAESEPIIEQSPPTKPQPL